ncbi:MAG: hypothetical protein JWN72_2589 [Thermoleophilia bacterium]|nr:hypothetical protein [Thermoleophilia bacterium]
MALPAIENVRVILGGSRIVDETVDMIGRAKTSLSGEFFTANEDVSRAALRAAWHDRDVPGSALITAHPQSIEQLEGIRGPRTAVTLYGALAPHTAPREFIHTKSVAINKDSAPEAILGSASLSPDSRWRFEAAGHVQGDVARAVHELPDAAASGDWQRQRDSIEWAQSLGIYLTDPVSRGRGLPNMISELIATEPTHLTVATKSFFNVEVAEQIARRHASDGLPIDVIVKRIDEESERVLRTAGVNLLKPADDVPEIHGNVTVATGLDQAYVGSLWFSRRSALDDAHPNPFTGGGGTLPRPQWWDRSRELGFLTSDSRAVTDLQEGVANLLKPHGHDFQAEVIRPTAAARAELRRFGMFTQ